MKQTGIQKRDACLFFVVGVSIEWISSSFVFLDCSLVEWRVDGRWVLFENTPSLLMEMALAPA